ncbi:hypothetical protein [Nakamurella antarctica]|uniref:hypothetical protein n=1 Tax=Nakamurella antarctica TaxID=1902245 RepID=UPI0013DDB4DD|nr:hypothetical protein [Nakamurella antarctica]
MRHSNLRLLNPPRPTVRNALTFLTILIAGVVGPTTLAAATPPDAVATQSTSAATASEDNGSQPAEAAPVTTAAPADLTSEGVEKGDATQTAARTAPATTGSTSTAPTTTAPTTSAPTTSTPSTSGSSSTAPTTTAPTTSGPKPGEVQLVDAYALWMLFSAKTTAGQIQPPGNSEVAYVAPNLVTNTQWLREAASLPDPSTSPTNKLTPRTLQMVEAVIASGQLKMIDIGCVSGRAGASDHPGGRACDLFFNYRTPAGVAAGWKMANWLVANQAVLGVKYVIWQGKIWEPATPVEPWDVYNSSVYGCPNPANVTGCHYDHVHVSMF